MGKPNQEVSSDVTTAFDNSPTSESEMIITPCLANQEQEGKEREGESIAPSNGDTLLPSDNSNALSKAVSPKSRRARPLSIGRISSLLADKENKKRESQSKSPPPKIKFGSIADSVLNMKEYMNQQIEKEKEKVIALQKELMQQQLDYTNKEAELKRELEAGYRERERMRVTYEEMEEDMMRQMDEKREVLARATSLRKQAALQAQIINTHELKLRSTNKKAAKSVSELAKSLKVTQLNTQASILTNEKLMKVMSHDKDSVTKFELQANQDHTETLKYKAANEKNEEEIDESEKSELYIKSILGQLAIEKNELEMNIENLKHNLLIAEEALVTATSSLQATKKERERVREEVREVGKRAERMAEGLRLTRSQWEILEERVKEGRRRKEELVQEEEEEERERDRALQEVNRLEMELTRQVGVEREKEEERERVVEEIEKLKREIERERERANENQALLDTLNADLLEKGKVVEQTNQETREMEARVKTLLLEKESLVARHQALTNDVDRAHSAVLLLNNELEKADKDYKVVMKELDQAIQLAVKAEEGAKKATNQLKAMTYAANRDMDQRDQLKVEQQLVITRLEEAVAKERAAIASIEKELTELEQITEQERRKVTHVLMERDKTKREIEKRESMMREEEKREEETRERIRRCEGRQRRLGREIEVIHKRMADCQHEKDMVNTKREEVEKTLLLKREECMVARQSVDVFAEMDRLDKVNMITGIQLEERKRRVAMETQRYAELERELGEAHRSREQLLGKEITLREQVAIETLKYADAAKQLEETTKSRDELFIKRTIMQQAAMEKDITTNKILGGRERENELQSMGDSSPIPLDPIKTISIPSLGNQLVVESLRLGAYSLLLGAVSIPARLFLGQSKIPKDKIGDQD